MSNDLANHCAVRESDPDASAYSCLTTLPQRTLAAGMHSGPQGEALLPMEVGVIFEHSADPKNAYGALSFARGTL